MRFFVFDASGAITRWGEAPADQVEHQARAGEFLGIGDCQAHTHWVPFSDGEPQAPVAYTDAERAALAARPPYPAHWDIAARQWIDERDLEAVRADTWVRIKAARSAAEYGGFDWTHDGAVHRFDADAESQRRIQGAAQMAQLALAQAQPFEIVWTLADNSTVTLDAADMIAVGMAMAAHVNACHVRGRELRAQIEAAATKAELDAIAW